MKRMQRLWLILVMSGVLGLLHACGADGGQTRLPVAGDRGGGDSKADRAGFGGGFNPNPGTDEDPDNVDGSNRATDGDKPEQPGGTVSQGDKPDDGCGYGVVYGLICSKDDQTFVNGATVSIAAEDCDGTTKTIETLSDDNGFYTLEGVPSGLQTIQVKKDDWSKEYTVLVKDAMLTDVTGVGYKECFKAVNQCAVGGIWGMVCHEDGTPYGAGADVSVDGLGCNGEPQHEEAKTDAEGGFFFGNLKTGVWTVTVAGGGEWLSYEVTVADGVVTDIADIGVEFCFEDMECGQGTLTGYACIPGQDDFFLSGAEVSVLSQDCDGNAFSAKTFTDAEGVYLFTGVPSGPANVQVKKDGLQVGYDLVVPAGGTANAPDIVDDVCFPEQCIPGAVTGYVCAPGQDFFIGGAKVWIDGVGCDGQPVHIETFSDGNGVYMLQGVPKGQQLVHVEKGGFTKQYQVMIPPGGIVQAQDLVDDLCFPTGQQECAAGDITGYVCAPNNTLKIGGAHVWTTAFDCTGKQVTIDTFSDDNGNFVLKNVPSGETKVFIEKGQFKTEYVVNVPPNGVVNTPDVVQDACFPKQSVKFAVVSGQWDHIETILSQLGVDYDLYDGTLFTFAAKEFLTNSQKMAQYDAIFFDCGSQHYDILTFNQNLIINNLQNFVANGGSVYASDWAFVYVEWPWPGAIDFFGGDFNNSAPKVGKKGNMGATVVDAGMAGFLGKSNVSINFNLGAWVVMAGAPFSTTTQITASVPQVGQAPLMVSHKPSGANGGTVLYTTFHNETQPTKDMIDILNYMVFSI